MERGITESKFRQELMLRLVFTERELEREVNRRADDIARYKEMRAYLADIAKALGITWNSANPTPVVTAVKNLVQEHGILSTEEDRMAKQIAEALKLEGNISRDALIEAVKVLVNKRGIAVGASRSGVPPDPNVLRSGRRFDVDEEEDPE